MGVGIIFLRYSCAVTEITHEKKTATRTQERHETKSQKKKRKKERKEKILDIHSVKGQKISFNTLTPHINPHPRELSGK